MSISAITGGHGQQDQICLVKMVEHIGFYVYHRSFLLTMVSRNIFSLSFLPVSLLGLPLCSTPKRVTPIPFQPCMYCFQPSPTFVHPKTTSEVSHQLYTYSPSYCNPCRHAFYVRPRSLQARVRLWRDSRVFSLSFYIHSLMQSSTVLLRRSSS